MHLKHDENSGGLALETQSVMSDGLPIMAKALSSVLPIDQLAPTTSLSQPTYVTAQLLVQQIAYLLSDKIFSYSPETFDLDVAAREWSSQKEKNIHGFQPTIVPLQTRTGAGAFALGYIFSKDFDLSKKHIPQSVLAPSSSLRNLRAALDQLSLLYSLASPFVAHVAAADYSSQEGLVTEYGTALQLSEDLGLGLVSSSTAYDTQHMALFSTLMAKILPTLHVYDGVRTSRESLRVVDLLDNASIKQVYNRLSKRASRKHDHQGQVADLLRAFNDELGTEYEPFEYFGHEEAQTK